MDAEAETTIPHNDALVSTSPVRLIRFAETGRHVPQQARSRGPLPVPLPLGHGTPHRRGRIAVQIGLAHHRRRLITFAADYMHDVPGSRLLRDPSSIFFAY